MVRMRSAVRIRPAAPIKPLFSNEKSGFILLRICGRGVDHRTSHRQNNGAPAGRCPAGAILCQSHIISACPHLLERGKGRHGVANVLLQKLHNTEIREKILGFALRINPCLRPQETHLAGQGAPQNPPLPFARSGRPHHALSYTPPHYDRAGSPDRS